MTFFVFNDSLENVYKTVRSATAREDDDAFGFSAVDAVRSKVRHSQ